MIKNYVMLFEEFDYDETVKRMEEIGMLPNWFSDSSVLNMREEFPKVHLDQKNGIIRSYWYKYEIYLEPKEIKYEDGDIMSFDEITKRFPGIAKLLSIDRKPMPEPALRELISFIEYFSRIEGWGDHLSDEEFDEDIEE